MTVDAEYAFRLVFLFSMGACLGSWLNVCIHRLPKTDDFFLAWKSLAYPPSHCPWCEHRLAWYDNIPLLGYLVLRGRCRYCTTGISPRYFFVELLTACLFVAFYWVEIPPGRLGMTFADSGLDHPFGPRPMAGSFFSPEFLLHVRYALHMVLVLALIAATFIDFDHRIIPDAVTLPPMGVALVGHTLFGALYVVPIWYQDDQSFRIQELFRLAYLSSGVPSKAPWWWEFWNIRGMPQWIPAHPHWHGLAVAVAGLFVGGCIVLIVRNVGTWVLKREAMGFGDVVLLAMIGSITGWQVTIIVFFLAPLLAIVFALFTWIVFKDRESPYGPYLSAATIVVLLFWNPIYGTADARLFIVGPLLPVLGVLMLTALAGLLGATRLVHRVLGFRDEPEEEGRWLSSDQLQYYHGEWSDPHQGQWRNPITWPGEYAARGQLSEQTWLHADTQLPPAREQSWHAERGGGL